MLNGCNISSKISLVNSFKKKCALVCLSFLVLPGCQADKTDIEYVDSAKKFAVAGDMKSYEIYLKNALQLNPDNVEARVLLGKRYLSAQMGALAEKEFQRAIDAGFERAGILAEILQSKYYEFQYNEIIEIPLSEVALEGEDKARAYLYHGLANLNLNKKWEAEADFKDAASVGGESPSVILAQSYVLSLELKYEDAQNLLGGLIVKKPDNTEAHILSSRLFEISGDYDKAIDAANKAIALEPSRLKLYVFAAKNYINNKQLDLAEQYLDKVLKAAPNHLLSNLMKANLRLQAKDWEGAKSAAQVVLAQNQLKEALLIAGISDFYLQNWELARNNLNMVKASLKPDHLAHRLLAFAESKLGYEQSADSILNSMGKVQAHDGKLLSFFGGEFLKEGRRDEAVKVFSAAAAADPEDLKILSALGLLKLEQNDPSGIVDLEKVLESDVSSSWARAAIVRNHLQNGRNDEAIEVAQASVDSAPEKKEGYLLLANVFAELKDITKAKDLLNQALEKEGDNKTVYQRLFQIAVAEKSFEAAAMFNSKVLEAEPANKVALMNKYRLGKAAGDTTDAIQAIEAVLKDNKNNEELQLLSALLYIDSGNREKGFSALKSIKTTSSFYDNAQAALGGVYAREREYEQAIPYFREWVVTSPAMLTAHQALITAQIKAGKLEDALASNQLALQQLPDNRLLELSEIRVLLDLGNKDQGLNKAKIFKSKYSESPELDFSLGQFFARNKDYSESLGYFQAAHRQAGTSRSVIAVAEIQNIMGQKENATKLLTEWLNEKPNDQVVRLYLANASSTSDQNNAIEQYRKLIELDGNNYIALNNLAWLLGEKGNLTEAILHAESAVNLQPKNAQALDTLGFLLLRAGDIAKAKDVLESAHMLDKLDSTVAYHYALSLKENGDMAAAAGILRSLPAQDFPEAQAAKTLLNEIE
ncbi:XrtA/PEP-CTERM system TPR-repeat protein PrsT [Neptunomonas antarctica]|uniref:Putative PEP-CTERM system TPR-repeat lipoprotein n=1 Tax=Neptunomonas antarctica TaxID=619304 RepID=A0A1N7JEX9_9GAMM|nr:XrtA/PEP-CTERM system TPR-repeat protein PrsT [Neptunomonas antarctica]SIS47887.1 putative PEP-CTERM system TPR-repeat lipoprotein [Neptunomonas antarctica]